MRLLFLTNFYPPHHMGGYEELCAEVAHGLSERGHQASILTSNHGVQGRSAGDSAGDGEPSEVPVYRLLHHEVDLRPFRALAGYFAGRQARREHNHEVLRHVAAHVRPDALLTWGMWNLSQTLPAQAERGGGASYGRVVYYLADYWPSLPDAYTLFWRTLARRRITQLPKAFLAQLASRWHPGDVSPPPLRFEHVACVSRAVRERLVQDGLPLEHAQIIHNGIDLAAFGQPHRETDRKPDKSGLSLLYAGRISPDKGVDAAIEALGPVLRDGYAAHLTIVGSGPMEYEQELRVLANRIGVDHRVTFRGRVPRERMPHELASADVVLVPSTWHDPLPRIVQEAMASRSVVVAARVGGIPEIVNHGTNGLTFSPGNADELATHIKQLAADAPLRMRLAEAGRRTVEEHFTIDRMVGELEEYLTGILARPVDGVNESPPMPVYGHVSPAARFSDVR